MLLPVDSLMGLHRRALTGPDSWMPAFISAILLSVARL